MLLWNNPDCETSPATRLGSAVSDFSSPCVLLCVLFRYRLVCRVKRYHSSTENRERAFYTYTNMHLWYTYAIRVVRRAQTSANINDLFAPKNERACIIYSGELFYTHMFRSQNRMHHISWSNNFMHKFKMYNGVFEIFILPLALSHSLATSFNPFCLNESLQISINWIRARKYMKTGGVKCEPKKNCIIR